MRHRYFLLIVFPLLLLLPLFIRAVWSVRVDLRAAREFVAAGNVDAALDSYRHVLAWALPGSAPLNDAAVESTQLIEKAILEPSLKLKAWNELKRGLYAGRSFLRPYRHDDELVERIETEILALQGARTPNDISYLEKPTLHYGYQAFAGWSFIGWILSVVFLIWKGISPDGSLRRRYFIRYGSIAIVLYLLWAFSLLGS
jgi:hypothetical protein